MMAGLVLILLACVLILIALLVAFRILPLIGGGVVLAIPPTSAVPRHVTFLRPPLTSATPYLASLDWSASC